MKTTIRMEQQVAVPTIRERSTREALGSLPEVSVENLPGWSAYVAASERLTAAEAVMEEAKASLRQAQNTMREFIFENWTRNEIGREVLSVIAQP